MVSRGGRSRSRVLLIAPRLVSLCCILLARLGGTGDWRLGGSEEMADEAGEDTAGGFVCLVERADTRCDNLLDFLGGSEQTEVSVYGQECLVKSARLEKGGCAKERTSAALRWRAMDLSARVARSCLTRSLTVFSVIALPAVDTDKLTARRA